METQQFRITRTNPGINFTIPCDGGMNFWPINTSQNCSGLTMYQATGSQVMNAINYDMNNFPTELRNCSLLNPCVILWDLTQTSNQNDCNNIGGYKYVKFKGLKLTSGSTVLMQTYNEFVPAVYDINNLSTSVSLPAQNSGAHFSPIFGPCGCDNEYLSPDLYKLTTLLTQDINDIGHYTVWDGNIGQKEVFANFVYSGTANNWGIKLFNTTDFGYYPSLQDSEYIIDWGDGTIETLQYPQLKSEHIYCMVPPCPAKQYMVTINHKTPWGPVSSSKVITIPHKDYIGLLVEPYVPSTSWTGGTGLGQQQFMYTYTPPGTTAQTTSIAYHAMYPTTPLDSGTNINQYSGMSFNNENNPIPCFTVSGVTDSMLGSFKQYTGTTNDPNLPGGYMVGIEVSIAGDVLSPITNDFVAGIEGKIISASPAYTAYTLYSSVNQRTPIDFYDFPNGITIFIAESCGLDAFAFGGGACYECPNDTCEWCLTKDEYVDRVTGIPTVTPSSKSPASDHLMGIWNNYTDYIAGDIVFDKSFNDCCCYMLVYGPGIVQLGPSTLSPFAGIAPALAHQGEGIYTNSDINPTYPYGVHVWEACSPACVSCPVGSLTPCDDATLVDYGNINWDSGTTYNVDDYVQTLNGCYQALTSSSDQDPNDLASVSYWDYVGCVHWSCPIDPTSPGGCVRAPGVGGAGTYMIWGSCDDAVTQGTCYQDRWLCTGNTVTSQYDCGGCTKIDATHPDWGNGPPALTGPSFQNENDCLTFCKPPIYVCSVKTSWPCCEEVTCADSSAGFTISNPGIPGAEKGLNSTTNYPSAWDYDVLTTSGVLNQDFHLDMAACQAQCCNLINYNWSCELGCHALPPTVPGQFADLAICEAADHGDFLDTLGQSQPYSEYSNLVTANWNICGWNCTVQNTNCNPCYTDGCSSLNYLGPQFNICNQNCSAVTECWVCDCDDTQNCQYQAPCPTLAWPSSFSGERGPDPNDYWGGGASYVDSANCDLYCECDSGWDCWIDIATTAAMGTPTSNSGCEYIQSSYMLPLQGASGVTATPNGPYSTLEGCCTGNTDCCLYRCDAFWPPWGDAVPMTVGGDWPCQFVQPASSPSYDANGVFIPPGTCGTVFDPFIPFCTLLDCQNNVIYVGGNDNVFCNNGLAFGSYYDVDGTTVINPTAPSDDWCIGCPGEAQTPADTCYCACSDDALLLGATATDRGAWVSSNPYYTYGDITSYLDATQPLCCYICGCYSADTAHPLQMDGTVDRQCGVHSPADGATFNANDGSAVGIINCWQSCELTPSGVTSDPTVSCVLCGSGPTAPSYSCGGQQNPDPSMIDQDPTPDANGVYTSGGYLGGCAGPHVFGVDPEHCDLTGLYDNNMLIQIALQTAANCFSEPQCYGKCMAGCFCDAGGSPYTAGTSNCVTQQHYDNTIASHPNAYGGLVNSNQISFALNSLDQCNSWLNSGYINFDCCGNPRYNCLSGHTCDPASAATQLSEMYGAPLDACVPLYPYDVGYDDAQFRDEVATATTISLCDGSPTTFIQNGNRTPAYMMCSYYCRYSCHISLNPPSYCHFVGNDPSELSTVHHWEYNNGLCAVAPGYTSAYECMTLTAPDMNDCFCNTDWVDCVPESTTSVAAGFSSLIGGGTNPVTNTTNCNCIVSSTGVYHTLDECQNPQNYPSVPSSCCDGSIAAWCLAVGSNLKDIGGCDGVTGQIIDGNLLDIEAYTTNMQTNQSGMPGSELLKQYYNGANYYPYSPLSTNQYGGAGLSPNMLYALQAQISYITEFNLPNLSDGLASQFESYGLSPIWGTECVEPHIPLAALVDNTTMVPNPGFGSSQNNIYGWGVGTPVNQDPNSDGGLTGCLTQGIPYWPPPPANIGPNPWSSACQELAEDNVKTICCLDINGEQYIKQRVKSITHEYIIHADQHLTSTLGTVPMDNNNPYSYDYSNLNSLLKAATYIGVTGLTKVNAQQGWSNDSYNGFWSDSPSSAAWLDQISGTTDPAAGHYYCTDIHEILYQTTKQYYERIFFIEMGVHPPFCQEGEEHLTMTSSTTTASTYTSCARIKTKPCCAKGCFCTQDDNEFTWGLGIEYVSATDPSMSTGVGEMATIAPYIMDISNFAITFGQSNWGTGTGDTGAYGEGYYNNHDCKQDNLSCCGNNTEGLVYGCTDPAAFNFDCKSTTWPTPPSCNDNVNIDDGSCIYIPAADYYSPNPGECVWGCYDDALGGTNMDTEGGGGTYLATNYNPIANCYSACTYI